MPNSQSNNDNHGAGNETSNESGPGSASAPTSVIFIMGPTASGKTDLAIELSKLIPSELISVDSALVYRGMDIGSAKPDAETLGKYPHRLVDIRDPADAYSAADFIEDAQSAIDDIVGSGKTPILVGGTVLYFKALLEGMDGMPAADPKMRKAIEERAEKLGWPALHEELKQIDPETAARLHPNHNQRIQRALEVYQITGRPMSAIHAEQASSEFSDRYKVHQLAIMPTDRKTLHERIEKRLDLMFQAGFVDEVRAMHERKDLHRELPSVRAVGYRQLWSYLDGECDLDEAQFRALVATRNLAKRQLTWLRSWPELPVLYTDNAEGVTLSGSEIVSQALKLLNLNLC